MDRIFIPLYRFLKRHRALMYFLMIASSLVFLYYGTKIVFIEDITKLLPQEGPASKSSLVFGDLKVKDMVMLQVTSEGKTGAELAEISDEFVEQLKQADVARAKQSGTDVYIADILSNTNELLSENYDKINGIKDSLLCHIPIFFDESQIEKFDSQLNPEALGAAMRKYSDSIIEVWNTGSSDQLISPDQMINIDPAGLLQTLLPSDGPELMGGVKLIDGHLMSKDSTVALSFISPSFNSVESDKCAEMIKMIEAEAERFEANNPEVDVLFHGIPVNAAYNSRQIKKDVALTIGISLIIICIIFGFIFRNKSTLPLLLAPIAWGAMFALSCIYWIQGTISLLAMGLGAVLLGVALSYCLHIITHYKYVSNPEKVLKDQSSPVFLGCLTTIGAFVALLFTNSSLLRDFGIFATLSILGTVFFSLVFTPQFLRPERNKLAKRIFKALDKINDYPFDKRVVLRWLIVLVCGVCIWASSKVGFDSDLRNIGYHDPEVIRSRELYADKFNDGNHQLYFATFDDSLDVALANTSKLTCALDSLKQEGKICSYMDISQIFVPKDEQLKRLEAWNAYWGSGHAEKVMADINVAAEENLDPSVFGIYYPETFQEVITAEYPHTTYSIYDEIIKEDEIVEEETEEQAGVGLDDLIGNFIDQASGKYLVMTSAVMPKDCFKDVSAVINDIPEVVVVDPNFYSSELVKVINKDFNSVLGISSIFVLIVLLISFRSIVLALIAFIPMSVSWYVVQGVMGLMGMDFNMINIVIATFIFGVGVDYSIFVMKGLLATERGEDNKLLVQHKTAIFLSAFMLIMALGSLLFATHPAISSVGFTTLIGMSSTVILTYTIQPALFKFMIKFKFFKRLIK